MEPRIQYAKTKDGVSIAFWTQGSGLPLVEMPSPPWSHVQLELQVPLWRAWDERLAENRTHVRYDHRGTGLSARNVPDVSLETLVLDLEAVVDRLGLEKFALFGHHITGAAAIAYAVKHPERVSQLILWCSYATTGVAPRAQTRALRGLLREDWQTYTETLAHTAFGWSEGEEAHRFAGVMRECTTPEIARAYFGANFEVANILAGVKCRTLVVQRRGYQLVPIERAQDLCSKIPNAELAILEGRTGVTYMENMDELAAAIDGFLGDSAEATAAPEAPQAPAVHTILFTDMESSTALTQRLGDAKAQELVRTHNAIVREALKAQGGSEIKHTGDGIMASFPSASGALECAVAIQQAVARQEDDTPLRLRIGLNAGEPVAEEDDLFGASVQLARRVCDHADPGQIVVADVVRQLATGKGFLFSDLGDVVPKGFEDPVRLYDVRWREEG